MILFIQHQIVVMLIPEKGWAALVWGISHRQTNLCSIPKKHDYRVTWQDILRASIDEAFLWIIHIIFAQIELCWAIKQLNWEAPCMVPITTFSRCKSGSVGMQGVRVHLGELQEGSHLTVTSHVEAWQLIFRSIYCLFSTLWARVCVWMCKDPSQAFLLPRIERCMWLWECVTCHSGCFC